MGSTKQSGLLCAVVLVLGLCVVAQDLPITDDVSIRPQSLGKEGDEEGEGETLNDGTMRQSMGMKSRHSVSPQPLTPNAWQDSLSPPPGRFWLIPVTDTSFVTAQPFPRGPGQ